MSLRELVLAQPETRVAQLMVRDVISARVDDDQDHIAKIMARYDLLALPIVDAQQALVGIITYDDAMDVASEEATEDFLKSGA